MECASEPKNNCIPKITREDQEGHRKDRPRDGYHLP